MPCQDLRRILWCPWKPERSPDVAEKTRVFKEHPRHNSRGNPMFLPQLEKNHETSPSPQDEARFSLGNRATPYSPSNTGGMTSFRQLQTFPKNAIERLEELRGQHSNSRRPLCTPYDLNMRADSHSTTREEYRYFIHTGGGTLSQLLKLEKNPKFPSVR